MSCTIRRLIYKYRQLKCTHPVLVHGTQIGLLFGLGDLISQTYFEDTCEIDWMRTAKATALGTFFVGPLATKWYMYLDRRIVCPPCKECSKLMLAIKKVLANELLAAPVLTAAGMVIIDLMQGKDLDGISCTLSEKYWEILKMNWLFWSGVHFFRYMFMIPRNQMVVVKAGMLIWATYLSYKFYLDECINEKMEEECKQLEKEMEDDD